MRGTLTGGFQNCPITVLKLPGRYLAVLGGVLGAVVSCQILARKKAIKVKESTARVDH